MQKSVQSFQKPLERAGQSLLKLISKASVLSCGLLFGAATAAMLQACLSSSEANLDLTTEEQIKVDQYRAELDVGRNMAGRLVQYFKAYRNPQKLRYLNTVGQLIVQNSPFAERRFVFGILDTPTINAFAVPGGYVLITRGALEQVESEAELAGILGHEIAHVGKLHVYNTMLKRMKADQDAEEEKSENLPETVKSRRRPRADANETASALAKYIGGASGGHFNILSAISKGLGVLLEEGLDPKLEFEADTEGLKYAIAAGYEPSALVSYFKRILKQKEGSSMAVLNKTHPSLDERINRAVEFLTELQADQVKGALGRVRYHKRMLSKRAGAEGASAQTLKEADARSED